MKDHRVFPLFWLINSIIFYFAPFFLVGMVATGNARLPGFLAAVISGFLLTLAIVATQPAFEKFNIKLKEDWQWLLVYLFVNVLAVWVIARYADLTGVGIANAWIAVLMGVILNLVQYLTWHFALRKSGKK